MCAQAIFRNCSDTMKRKQKEAMYVGNVIDFIAKKKEREALQRERELGQYVALHCTLDQPENIDALVVAKELEVKDHTIVFRLFIDLKGRAN